MDTETTHLGGRTVERICAETRVLLAKKCTLQRSLADVKRAIVANMQTLQNLGAGGKPVTDLLVLMVTGTDDGRAHGEPVATACRPGLDVNVGPIGGELPRGE